MVAPKVGRADKFNGTPTFRIHLNLIKPLFHLRLLDMRLVISKSALRASLAIDHLISIARPWNNCELYNAIENKANQNAGKSLHIRRYFTVPSHHTAHCVGLCIFYDMVKNCYGKVSCDIPWDIPSVTCISSYTQEPLS